MKSIPTLVAFLSFFALGIFAAPSAEAQQANVSATLILGTNDGGGVDPQLRRYEAHLKRVLRFDTFKQQGRGSASIQTPGSGAIAMGGGHRVDVQVADAGDGKLRISINWTRGGSSLINTTVVAPSGQPTVLGGPNEGSGKLILLLEAS